MKSEVAGFISKVETTMRECEVAFQGLDELIAANPASPSMLSVALVTKARCERAKEEIKATKVPTHLAESVGGALEDWSGRLGTGARYLSQIAYVAVLYARSGEPKDLNLQSQRAASKCGAAR